MPSPNAASDELIIGAIRELQRKGKPEKVVEIRGKQARGEKITFHYLNTLLGKVVPEKSVQDDESLDPPPREGRGASKTAWREFVLKTIHIEKEVAESLSRDELIELAIERNVIPKNED